MTTLAEDFVAFVTKARTVVHPLIVTPPIQAFQNFIDKAMPLIFKGIGDLLPEVAKRANLVGRWLVKDDLLAVAGCRFVEDAYTELMAWALKPATHPASAEHRQRAWLAVLGLDHAVCADGACDPRTQVHTEDGIPDLVMHFNQFTVGVEAKTGSTEHLAPSGKMQTVAYAESLRAALNLTPDHQLKMVFITPDGRQASNAEAVCTTYTEFVLAIANALDGYEIPHDTRAAFAIFFTHMLTCATPMKTDVRRMIERIQSWSAKTDWDDHKKIIQRWGTLLDAIKFLKPERKL